MCTLAKVNATIFFFFFVHLPNPFSLTCVWGLSENYFSAKFAFSIKSTRLVVIIIHY